MVSLISIRTLSGGEARIEREDDGYDDHS